MPKKEPHAAEKKVAKKSGNLGKPFLLREPPQFDGLVDSLNEFAKRKNRSRNMAIVMLLAKAMRDAGLYQPPPDVELD